MLSFFLFFFSFASVGLTAPSPEPVNLDSLFKRHRNSFNGTQIGSDAWKALYPSINGTPSYSPQEWLDKLVEVERARLIPDASVNPVASFNTTAGKPSYGSLNSSSPEICSVTFNCYGPEDVVNAPDGKLTIAFDDGPDLGSPSLYNFLHEECIHGTHFLIGRQMIKNWELALQLRDIPGQALSVHTWSHPYLTTLTNEQVVAEIGWTMQLISDLSFGKIPGWWRPPYGDVDNRVRAIAKHVFGLKTVIWNHDPKDWAIDDATWFESDVRDSIQTFVNGSKTPGLIMLEHELSKGSAGAFISEYPTFAEKGWKTGNIPEVFDLPWYKNAFDDGSYINEDVDIASNGSLSLGTL